MNPVTEIVPSRLAEHRADGGFVSCEQIAIAAEPEREVPRRDKVQQWAIGIFFGILAGALLSWLVP